MHGQFRLMSFKGEGDISFDPKTVLERKQLSKFIDTETLQSKINQIHILFTYDIESELKESLQFSDDISTDDDEFNDFAKNFSTMSRNFRFTYLNNIEEKSLFAEFGITWALTKDLYQFQICTFDFEEVSFFRNRITFPNYKINELVNQIHLQEDYINSTTNTYDHLNQINIEHIDLNVKIKSNHDMNVISTFKFKPNREMKWLEFSLYYNLRVKSVKLNGKEISFYQFDESYKDYDLTFDFGSILKAGEEYALEIIYEGELFERNGNYIYYNSTTWYPYNSRHQTHSANLSYTVPDMYTVTSVGKLNNVVHDTENENQDFQFQF